MKPIVLLVGFIAVATASIKRDGPSLPMTGLPCTMPGNESAVTIQSLKEELASSDSNAIRWRNGFGLVGVDSASVSIVTDTTACTRITAVVDSAFNSSPSATALATLRAGPRYVAFDTSSQDQWYVLDSTFALLHVIVH